MSLKCLPKSTIKLIGSSQVITSVSAAVKELVENSLDAGASSIEVKLDNHGLDKIEIRDDGCGINKNDIAVLCKKSYTSKISCFEDLDSLLSYGFRGEALNALCSVSKLSITTKTEQDDLAYTYQFDNDGTIKDSKPSHINKGTIIVAEGLFRNLPVRRQFLTNGRRRSDEIKKVESVVKCLAIVHPRLRLTFTHNKFLIWQKNSVANLKQSLSQAIPPTIISQLDSFTFSDPITKLEMTALLPRKDCNCSLTCFSNRDDSMYLFINKRPIRHKDLEKTVEGELFQYFGHYIPANKYQFWLLSINLPPDGLDVNLEPNKTKLIIKDLDYLLDKLKAQFIKYYTGTQENPDARTPIEIKVSKRKIETDENEIDNSQENIKIPKIAELSASSDHPGSLIDSRIQKPLEESNYSDLIMIPETPKSSCSDNNDEVKHQKNVDANISSNDILNSQEFDELELMLATSSQTSIIVTPDLNKSLDCFGSENSTQVLQSPESDLSTKGNINQSLSTFVPSDINKSLDCFGSAKNTLQTCNNEESDISNELNSHQDNRDGNINDFLNGLPVSQYNENNYGFPKCTNEKEDFCIKDCLEGNNENQRADDISLDNPTLSQWSKGHLLESSHAPVIVKAGDRVNTIIRNVDVNNLYNSGNLMLDESILNSQADDSILSRDECGNVAAFTKFSSEMRTKIIQNQSGVSFNRVASELTSKWRIIADDEKNEEIESKEKVQMKENIISTPEPKLKQTTIKAVISAQGLKKIKYDKVVETNISINELRDNINSMCILENNFSKIIGKCDNDLYLFTLDNSIFVLSSSRLIESINFYKNMSNICVPLKLLEQNISVLSEDVGEKNWHTLQCLETSVDLRNNTVIIANEFIAKNGFRIEVIDDKNGRHFEITDVPTHVSFYGINDLREVLELIDQNGLTGSLLNCRPLKISSYIRSETIRNCSSPPANSDSKGIDSMFNFWIKNVKHIFPNCPHHKPVIKEVYAFKELEL